MSGNLWLFLGAFIVVIWGAAHIFPTQAVIAGFGVLSDDNRRILTMEWVAEGLAMIFIGLLTAVVALTSGTQNATAVLVYRLNAIMLVLMAVWTALTGARTSIVPIKICPIVKTGAAILLIIGSSL